MPLPTFKTQDEIPEAFRSEYEEKDGLWSAKVPEVGPTRKQIEQREAAALKRAKDAEARALELEQELAASSAGVSPEELQKVRASVEAQYTAKLTAAESRIRDLTFGAQMDALFADDAVDLTGARKLFDDRFEMSEAGTVVPKDDKSVPAKQFIADTLRAEKPWAFKGTQASGSGAAGSKGPVARGKMSYEDFQKLTPQQKQEYATANEKAA